ncbi:MAG: Holliday junction branch migration DNA helicase RuvB [Candidatus Peregrinibacteria bacterium]
MAISTSFTPTPSATTAEEQTFEMGLRPLSFSEFVGQEQIKKNLKVFIDGAKKRKEPLHHALLSGPPGLGKTTLASIIAREMGGNLKITSGPAIEKSGDIAALLTSLEPNDVLFIDEIHRLKKPVEEILYSAMEDFALDLMVGKGAGAKSMRLSLPPFTLLGATTKMGSLSAPLRDRFGGIFKFQFYIPEEMEKIIHRSARILEIDIEKNAVEGIASAARSTPRIANRILRHLRDFAHAQNSPCITNSIAKESLIALGIDGTGLDENDRQFLLLIVEKFNGGPVGLSTLSAALSEDRETIEEIIEPYLLQCGFLNRTPKGRVITGRGMEALGVEVEGKEQEKMF